MPENIPVRVRDCACPDTPHADGDFVYLAPKLSLAAGLAAQSVYEQHATDPNLATGLVLEEFVRRGIVGGNYEYDIDELTTDYSVGRDVAIKAVELYGDGFLRPLAQGRPQTSKPGPTAGSTSATRRSTRRSR